MSHGFNRLKKWTSFSGNCLFYFLIMQYTIIFHTDHGASLKPKIIFNFYLMNENINLMSVFPMSMFSKVVIPIN